MAEGTEARYGAQLLLWMILIAALHGVLWVTGFKDQALRQAVDRGAVQAERRVVGETDEDSLRETVRTQYDTLPFWTALAVVGDLLIEPLMLALRVTVVATSFSMVAALLGRTARFDLAMAECVACQWIWVAELAVRVGLTVALRKPGAETSLVLLLPPGTHAVGAWVALRQIGVLAIVGWLMMAWRGWRRGEARLPAAVLICALLAVAEVVLRTVTALLIGTQMRLALIPT